MHMSMCVRGHRPEDNYRYCSGTIHLCFETRCLIDLEFAAHQAILASPREFPCPLSLSPVLEFHARSPSFVFFFSLTGFRIESGTSRVSTLLTEPSPQPHPLILVSPG